jgi:hypothetical protein
MKKALVLLMLAAAGTTAFAARPTIGNQPFPDDYVPHPCAPAAACASLSKAEVVDVGAAMRGYSLKEEWVDEHWDEMVALIQPSCRKLATCYATQGNQSLFCMDLMFPVFWGLCDRYPKDSEMYEQCSMFMRIYSLRADLKDKQTWQEAQACAVEKTPRTGTRPMKVWMSPETIGDGYDGKFTVYALDPETKVPIQALVAISDGSRLSARAPGGKPWTNYEIRWPVKFVRATNAAGHIDLVPPSITVTAEGYEPVTLTLPAQPRKAIVEMTPPAAKLKRGRNSVTVNARDAATGKPVELRVMLGENTILGDTNKPLELELKKGEKRPEIWATSLFNIYSDVVIAPAEK